MYAAVDPADRDMIDRLARPFGAIVGVERARAYTPPMPPPTDAVGEARKVLATAIHI
jgi:hypothetical protein